MNASTQFHSNTSKYVDTRHSKPQLDGCATGQVRESPG